MDIDKITDGFINNIGGEDAWSEALAEIAGEVRMDMKRKSDIDYIRYLYRKVGSDGCNLMRRNYFRRFRENYN
jgi:hypothetical protein